MVLTNTVYERRYSICTLADSIDLVNFESDYGAQQ